MTTETPSQRRLPLYLFLFSLSLLSIPAVFAANPHVNVTFSETVYQNVTYAKDFLLEENRTYSLIVGVLTVVNPGTETVFDTYLRVINTDYLASNFTYSSGRFGTQSFYTKSQDNVFNVSSTITTAYSNLGRDLDEDGVNDSVAVNATHILFNITSEYSILAYPLYNTTGAIANLATVQRFNTSRNINVTSIRIDGYNENVVYAVVTVNGTETTANQLNITQVNITINDTARPYTILHIPELRAGQQTIYNYNVSSLYVEPPLDVNTSYTNALFQTKVLAGQRFSILDTATNIVTVGDLNIINVSIYALGVNVTNGSSTLQFNFTLQNLSSSGDAANVHGNGTNNRSWYWIINGGLIPVGQTYNISYQVQAPDTVPTSATYPAVMQMLEYTINATASRVGINGVRARADVNFSVDKQIISPQDNLSNHNVTWSTSPKVSTIQNVSYTLEKVSLWVTSTLNPNNVANSLNTTYNVNSGINLTTTWSGAAWTFNFTDGSSDSAPPPIVWVKPYWIIQNTGGQILNQSITRNGTDTYLKYIYVINGYWLEVEKNVTSTANGSYNIKVWVHNRGNGHTPQNLTVTVYDFIDGAFTPYAFSPTYNNLSVVSGQFNGTAYQWDVGLRTSIATSFAPFGDAAGLDNYYLNYSANGTGDYRVSDLYIIGLDPRKVDNANTLENSPTVLTSIASTSKELIYLAIVVFLLAINIGNFLMTSRINKKLDGGQPGQGDSQEKKL